MNDHATNINLLIAAFTYSYASMNQMFYLRKRDLKVVGVHMFDNALLEGGSDYDSGLSLEEERDIKEAMIAERKNYDTHIYIPRLTKEQRFEMIEAFIETCSSNKTALLENCKLLKASTENYGAEFYKRGIKPGVEMEGLMFGIEEEETQSAWTHFYTDKTRAIAVQWLDEQKKLLTSR